MVKRFLQLGFTAIAVNVPMTEGYDGRLLSVVKMRLLKM